MLTHEHLSRFTQPCSKPITLNVFYDLDKIKFLHNNVTAICTKLGTEFDKTKNLGSQMKALSRKRTDHKKVKFGIPTESQLGRLRPMDIKDKSYVSITRPVRQFLVRDFSTDIDIKNCHPVFLSYLYEFFEKKPLDTLNEWNKNREEYFQTCIEHSTKGITRDDAKKLAFTFLYQGSVDKQFESLGLDIKLPEIQPIYELVSSLTEDAIHVSRLIKRDYPDLWKTLPYDKEKGIHRIDAGKFSSFMQNIERLCVTEIYHAAKDLGFSVIDFCHDGVLVSANDDYLDSDQEEQLCSLANQKILKTLGMDLVILAKPMDNSKTDELERWYNGDNEMNSNTVDNDKIDKLIPDTPTINLNNFKYNHPDILGLNKKEKESLSSYALGKYFLRVSDKWFRINKETGLFNHKPLGKDGFNQLTAGTIFEGNYSDPSIPIYDRFCFEDPNNVPPNEHNTYYKSLLYDRSLNTPLTSAELDLIQPWIHHQKDVMCSSDPEVYDAFISILKSKLLKPFEVNHNSRCLVLHGIEGAGKTTHLTKFFEKVFGMPYVNGAGSFPVITDPKGFTDSIESKLVVIMNEIPEYDRNHSHMFENFKALITDNHRRSRPMYMGGGSTKNTLMLIATTNNRNSIPASINCRRYVFLSVRPTYLGNYTYFSALHDCIEKHWKLIVQYILSSDIDVNQIMPIPNNALRKHAQSLKKDSIGDWLLDKVQETDWQPKDCQDKVKDFYAEYKDWCSKVPIRAYTRAKFIGKLADKYSIDVVVNNKIQCVNVTDYESFVLNIGWDGSSYEPDSPSPDDRLI